jgi:hypothetical protein
MEDFTFYQLLSTYLHYYEYIPAHTFKLTLVLISAIRFHDIIIVSMKMMIIITYYHHNCSTAATTMVISCACITWNQFPKQTEKVIWEQSRTIYIQYPV